MLKKRRTRLEIVVEEQAKFQNSRESNEIRLQKHSTSRNKYGHVVLLGIVRGKLWPETELAGEDSPPLILNPVHLVIRMIS